MILVPLQIVVKNYVTTTHMRLIVSRSTESTLGFYSFMTESWLGNDEYPITVLPCENCILIACWVPVEWILSTMKLSGYDTIIMIVWWDNYGKMMIQSDQ